MGLFGPTFKDVKKRYLPLKNRCEKVDFIFSRDIGLQDDVKKFLEDAEAVMKKHYQRTRTLNTQPSFKKSDQNELLRLNGEISNLGTYMGTFNRKAA